MSSSSSARISISSDEVNILIYRYLIEAGFKHTAFVFHGESLLHKSSNLVQADMPPGALVSLLQKALLYLYVESHVSNDGKQIHCEDPFSLFKPHDHDHGPIETPIQFDHGLSQPTPGVKRAESVDADEVIKPLKKQKQAEIEVQQGKIDDEEIESASVPVETAGALITESKAMDISDSGAAPDELGNNSKEKDSSETKLEDDRIV